MDKNQANANQDADASHEFNEEEVRENLIEEFGFDSEDDADKVDKLIEKERENHEKLSTAIKQKIKYRELASEKEDDESEGKSKKEKPKEETPDLDTKLNQAKEELRLEGMGYPDEINEVIQRVAKIEGVSVKEAAKDDFVQAKIKSWKDEQEVEEAAVSRTNKSTTQTPFSDDMPDVDMSTEEGRKKWDEWKESQRKKGL